MKMVEYTKENILMIKNTVKVFILGQMENVMMADGTKENNMVKQNSLIQEVKLDQVYGKME